jgi:lipopolysaccharide/colanic/teichoic acid biosynthesis glycosyltransferase
MLRQFGLTSHLGFLARGRYQVVGGILVGVILPALLWWRSSFISTPVWSTTNTMIGTSIAVLVGTYVMKRMAAYPGVQAFSFVLPAQTAVFAATALIFLLLRLDYSRYQFISCYVLTVAWFFFVTIIEARVNRQRLVVIPVGDAGRLLKLDSADWVVARHPEEVPVSSGVVADLRADLSPEWQRFLAACALKGVPVYHFKQVSESLTGSVEIEHLSENNFGSLLPSSIYFRVKRAVDLVGVLATAPVVLTLGALAGLAILLLDGRPVFFRQQRMGFRGEVFTILKFRTMRESGEGALHFTEENDPRITPVGRLLRRWRIDELPQIWHVLTGEMSWIGPRPEALPLSEWYESRIPFYSYRHIVRPGITGWAQVNQGNVAMIEAATGKLHYDFYYIKHFSPWLDLLISARTVRTILTGFGSK